MTTDEKIQHLENLILEINSQQIIAGSPKLVEWGDSVKVALDRIFPNLSYGKRLIEILNAPFYGSLPLYDELERQRELTAFRQRCVDRSIAFIRSKIRELKDWSDSSPTEAEENTSTVSDLVKIIDRFYLVVKQLRDRHGERETLDIQDEYDVQDLFHALLKLYFDDVRAEEWTPSYAGSSSRIDFLIPELNLAIETKMTRKGLANKDASDQLAIDKDHYRIHPAVKHLICFVYDPESRIKNPRGFEKDLHQDGPLKTDVYVRP